MKKTDEKDFISKYNAILEHSIDYLKYGFILPHGSLSKNAEDGFDNIAQQKYKNASVQQIQSDKNSSDSLDSIADAISVCHLCKLHSQRTKTVSGEGVSRPLVMVVGEAPGEQEDLQGRPFIGAAGQYLDKWLDSIQLSRMKNVFITNTVKCRPPNNRDPQNDEYSACSVYLIKQTALLHPVCILAVGRIAANLLLGATEKRTLASMRNKVHAYANIPVFVTYHPSAVLRNPSLRRSVWDDLQTIRRYLDEHEKEV